MALEMHCHTVLFASHASCRTISTYATIDMLWSRSKERWLSSVESLQAWALQLLLKLHKYTARNPGSISG